MAMPPASAEASGSLAVVVASVQHLVPAQKGTTWSFKMLYRKELKAKAKVPGHAQKKIARYNANTATRRADQICLQRKRPVIKGRGKYKSWLPNALLRACWGRGARQNAKGKSRPSSAAAGSARVVADFVESSHSHVAQVRGAVASKYIEEQNATLESVGAGDHGVMCISLDETGMKLVMEHIRGTQHFCTLHAFLHWRQCIGNPPQRQELACAPRILRANTTACMVEAPLEFLRMEASLASNIIYCVVAPLMVIG